MTDKENEKKETEHDDADANEEPTEESTESVYEIFSEKFTNFRKFVKEDCRWLVLNNYVQNEEYITVDSVIEFSYACLLPHAHLFNVVKSLLFYDYGRIVSAGERISDISGITFRFARQLTQTEEIDSFPCLLLLFQKSGLSGFVESIDWENAPILHITKILTYLLCFAELAAITYKVPFEDFQTPSREELQQGKEMLSRLVKEADFGSINLFITKQIAKKVINKLS